jgi:hypothetical protein
VSLQCLREYNTLTRKPVEYFHLPQHAHVLEPAKLNNCPPQTALCGVFHKKSTMSALKNIEIACCQIRNPMEFCEPNYIWIPIQVCHKELECSMEMHTGFNMGLEKEQGSSSTKSVKTEYDYSVGAKIYGFSASFEKKYGSEISDGTSLSQVFRQSQENSSQVNLDMAECGDSPLEQLVLSCGTAALAAKHFRC